MALPTVILRGGIYDGLPVTAFHGTQKGARVLMGPTHDVNGHPDRQVHQFLIAVYHIVDNRTAEFSHMEVLSGGSKLGR